MRKPQWGAAVALAATLGVVPAAADEAMAATKAAMDGMKIEMEAMRAQLAAEREALRARAGGAPEGLTSANGKATIRIGGDVRIQYGFGWTGGWDRDGYVAYDEPNHDDRNTNFRSSFGGWDVARAELDFAIDLSCDTRGFVALRFDERGAYGRGILDKAYWQWNDIGGSALSLSVGLMDMPFGMWANTDMGGYDFDGIDRPLIADPFVRTVNPSLIVPTKVDEDLGRPLGFGDTNRCFPYEDWNGVNVTNLGVVGAYHWDDQFIVKAGIMASEWELPGQGFDSRLTYANANRNVGVIDHVIAIGWNPCWLEGLHLEASYLGRFDEGRGVNLPIEGNPYANDYTQVRSGDHSYRPSFDLGFNYRVNDCWRVYGEGLMVVNPFWGDGSNFALTLGVDYRVTDKLSLGFGFDYFHARYGAEYYFNATHDDDDDGCWGSGALYENVYRFGLGAKYDFSRGIYLQAQYYHAIGYVSGIDDQRAHDADVFLFQTGYKF